MMFSLGDNNWIKYGWTEKLNSEHTSYDPFVIDFTNCGIIKQTSALEAAIEAIDIITKKFNPPYYLMCSGGVDSQSMAYSWLKSEHDFNIVSVKYVSNGTWFNDYDLIDIEKFSNFYNLNVNFIEFDIINFLENDLSYLAKKYDCDSPQICTHMAMTNHIKEGTAIFAGSITGPKVRTDLNYTLLGMHRYSLKVTNKQIVPFFFLHTPNLVYNFDSLEHLGPNLSRYMRYKENGFNIFEPIRKYNGFEKVKEYYDTFNYRVKKFDRLKYSSMPSKRNFDLLFRYPYCNKKGACSGTYSSVSKFL